MTPKLLQLLLEKDWIRSNYYVSDITGKTVTPYGVLLLSKIAWKQLLRYQMPVSKMDRDVTMAIYLLNNQEIVVATTHLESYVENMNIRSQQLQSIMSLLSPYSFSVLMGDFNASSEEEAISMIKNQPLFYDVWKELRPFDAGFTYDTENNFMIKKKILVFKVDVI